MFPSFVTVTESRLKEQFQALSFFLSASFVCLFVKPPEKLRTHIIGEHHQSRQYRGNQKVHSVGEILRFKTNFKYQTSRSGTKRGNTKVQKLS